MPITFYSPHESLK